MLTRRALLAGAVACVPAFARAQNESAPGSHPLRLGEDGRDGLIFIPHGTTDPVMPIDDTSRRFVPRLKTLGYDVTYREYDGRHTMSPPIVREAFEWFLK